MSNPVMSKMSEDFQRTTPAGYPSMPGYQVGSHHQPQAHQGYYQPSATSMDEFEQSYARPSADAVDRGTLTYDDVIVRSGISFGLVLVAGALTWYFAQTSPAFMLGAIAVGFLGGLVLAMVNSFSKTVRPALVMAYAVLEGVGLGAFSLMMENRFPGVVVQALLATAAVFVVVLALFASGKVRNSSRLMKITLVGILGIIVFRLASLLLTSFGVLGTSLSDVTLLGMPLGLVVSVVALVLATFSLVADFDIIKQGVEGGAPSVYAWKLAFGLLVTIIWMYMEILRILSYFRD